MHSTTNLGSDNVNKTYAIKKRMITDDRTTDVFLLDSLGELLEYNDLNEAINIAHIMTVNSDSGWGYFVWPINKI